MRTLSVLKSGLKIIVLAILLLLLFRGSVYRSLINYRSIGQREAIIITNKELIKAIDIQAIDRDINLRTIAQIANDITCDQLSFTIGKASGNPNELVKSQQANCIGYAAMFSSIADYLVKANNLEKESAVTHEIGKLDLLGIDVHQFFNSSFFKDHDFNILRNLRTKETLAIDPSLSDYLKISSVRQATR